jgi:DNA-binding NarL/FixJ family response regulator
MPRTLKNYHEIKEREEKIRVMLSEGMTQSQIAVELGLTRQSVQAFLKTRGWTKS